MKFILVLSLFLSAQIVSARPVNLRNDDAKEMMETMANVGLYVQTIDERTKRISSMGQLYCLYQTTSPEGFQQTRMCYTSTSGVGGGTANPEASLALLQKTRRYGFAYSNFGFPGFALKSVVCDLRTDTHKYTCTINND